MNLYADVANDPVNNTDPTGKFLKALKAAFNVGKRVIKGQDFKSAVKDEVLSIVDNVATLADGELTIDDAFAVVDLVTGFGDEAKAGAKLLRGTCCFVAGTQVFTEQGLRNIENIQKGDLVWAENPETGEKALKPVVGLIRLHDRVIWNLTLANSNGKAELFGTTDDHPWWSLDRLDWVQTIDLKPGERISTYDGDVMTVVSKVNTGQVQPTFNFEVADFHTYFVGEDMVLVHNMNCGGKPGNQADRGSPAVDGDPYSPTSVSQRQSETRREMGTGNHDPNSPIPDQGPGGNPGGHSARKNEGHDTGERNVNRHEEHSRRPKGGFRKK